MAGAHQLIALLTISLLATATPVSQSGSYAVAYAPEYTSDNASTGVIDIPSIYEHNTNANPNNAAIHCYLDDAACYGISRKIAAEALLWYCNHFNGYKFVDSSTACIGDWYYKPNDEYENSPTTEVWEEGRIHMEMVTISTCEPNILMAGNVCYTNMMAAIDSCDTITENNKHGGTASSGCVQYRFQPNPDYWPKCKTSATQTPSG